LKTKPSISKEGILISNILIKALVLLENSLEAERFRLFTDFHRARIEVPRNLARELYGQMFSLFSSGSYTLPDQINSSCNKWNDRVYFFSSSSFSSSLLFLIS